MIKKIFTYFSFIVIVFFVIFVSYYRFLVSPKPIVKSVVIKDDVISVSFDLSKESLNDEIYYLFKNDESIPLVNDERWILAKENKFDIKIDDKVYYIFLKNADGEVFFVDGSNSLGNVLSITTSKKTVYIAKGGSYKVSASALTVGNISNEIRWRSENEKIAISVKPHFQ